MDVSNIEAAEGSIDGFIEKIARESVAEKEREVVYAESVRRYHTKRRRRNRERWISYHLD